MASQMSSAVLDTLSVDIAAGKTVFRATGSKVRFPGFMKVYVEGNDGTTERKINTCRSFIVATFWRNRILSRRHFLRPPPRYTEARLVRTLEELGIGRPSTYAPTLETIQKRGYVAIEEKNSCQPSSVELVIEQMEQFFPEILNVEFTANMEEDLDHVEEGSEDGSKYWQSSMNPLKSALK